MTIATQINFIASEDRLHEAASEATGLSDFGNVPEYRPGLHALLQALDTDGPRFSPGGREFAFGTLVGVLIARLMAERGLRDHPQALTQPIVRPLIITGMPRTGTTALHKLLSMDEQFQGLERWLTAFPMPRPPSGTWEANPNYRATVEGLDAFFAGAPSMRAAHNMVASDVDECLEVLKQNYCSNNFGSTFRVPGYDQWWHTQSEAASYRRFGQVLRLIGANASGKSWLLKNPGHVAQLDELFNLFPDASVVQTHRDPIRALPSLCSVLAQARGLTEGANVVMKEIGGREIAYWHAAATRAMFVSAARPKQFIDVRNEELHRNPIGVVERIYDRFGYRLDGTVVDRMRKRIKADPEGSHGEHVYTAAEFGLSAEIIRERFAGYSERYLLT